MREEIMNKSDVHLKCPVNRPLIFRALFPALLFGVLGSLLHGWVFAAEGEEKALAELKDYYSSEKSYWDGYLEKNCLKETSSANCVAAQKMQETYVYLLTDLIRDKSIRKMRSGEAERQVYEVPVIPEPRVESAAVKPLQPAPQDTP